MVLRNMPDEEGDLLILERNMLGVSAVPLFIRLLELLVLSRRMGPLMLIIQNVLSEVFYFLFLALLMIVAFAQAVTVLFNEPGRELEMFKTFGHSCGTLFISMLGILDESKVEEMREKYTWMGPLTIISYLLITSVILLNLLIAILSNIYKKIDDKSNEEWMFLWASTVMRLQKEVQETLPPPLNVILRLLKILPKKVREKIVFVMLMLVKWIPMVAAFSALYLPFKIVHLLTVITNPFNWKNGGGNPFAGAKIDSMSSMSAGDMGMGGSEHGKGTMFFTFIDENFTNQQEMMMGRDTNTFSYDSRQRATIMDEKKLMDKDLDAYHANLQKKRDDLRETLSMSNGDPVSLLSELSAVQDLQGKAIDDTSYKLEALKMKLDGLESMMRMCNMSLKALRDQAANDSKAIKAEFQKGNKAPSAVPASAAPVDKEEEEEEEEEGSDVVSDIAVSSAPASMWGGLGSRKSGVGARKTKFSRPRRISKL
jgi:hypothetical protein